MRHCQRHWAGGVLRLWDRAKGDLLYHADPVSPYAVHVRVRGPECGRSLKEGASLFDIGLAVPAASLYGILFFTICYIWYVRKKG